MGQNVVPPVGSKRTDHIKNRNMVMQVLLAIVTLGIYVIYRFYVTPISSMGDILGSRFSSSGSYSARLSGSWSRGI